MKARSWRYMRRKRVPAHHRRGAIRKARKFNKLVAQEMEKVFARDADLIEKLQWDMLLHGKFMVIGGPTV